MGSHLQLDDAEERDEPFPQHKPTLSPITGAPYVKQHDPRSAVQLTSSAHGHDHRRADCGERRHTSIGSSAICRKTGAAWTFVGVVA